MDLRERLMDEIGVFDTDPALSVFVKYLREQSDDEPDVNISLKLSDLADRIEEQIDMESL